MALRPLLVVDDDAGDRDRVAQAIGAAHINNPVVELGSAGEMLDWLRRHGVDPARREALPLAIFLDLRMPVMDGVAALRVLRGDEALRRIPVVMLTHSQSPADIASSYASGANSYVVKPGTPEAFSTEMGRLGRYWCLLNQPPQS